MTRAIIAKQFPGCCFIEHLLFYSYFFLLRFIGLLTEFFTLKNESKGPRNHFKRKCKNLTYKMEGASQNTGVPGMLGCLGFFLFHRNGLAAGILSGVLFI